MLKITNLKCELGGQLILDIPQLSIDKPGLYVLLGPSGCGKTTLLNLISGLNINYTGSLKFFDKELRKTRKKQLVKIRANYLSSFFQHNVFLEDLNVNENISLSAVYENNDAVKLINSNNDNIASKLKIDKFLLSPVKKISGGEKTRSALARSLNKNVPFYLFDEPTASLDKDNAVNVMRLIKQKSEKSIVLLVSHDTQLARKYADTILYMEYGKIVKSEEVHITKKIVLDKSKDHNYHKNVNFIVNSLMRAKRKRNVFTNISVNLGLVGLGLSLLLVSSVNTKLISSFKGEFSEDSVYIEKTFSPKINAVNAASEEHIRLNLGGDYEIGSIYLNDFSRFFETINDLNITVNQKTYIFPSFDVSSFNEPLTLDEITTETFPYVNSLAFDEIGLVLPYDDFKMLQNVLGLPFKNSADDLGKYLQRNNVVVELNLANNYWDYESRISFRLKTVMLGYTGLVIVNDFNFTEHFFEELLLLPSSLSLTKIEDFPWVLKKVNYVYYEYQEEFLLHALNSPDSLVFTANKEYFKVISNDEYLNKRFIILESPPTFNDILQLDIANNTNFVTFNGGLNFIESLMLLGFSSNFFLADTSEKITEITNADINEEKALTPNLTLQEGVINLALQYNSFGSFSYSPDYGILKLKEISISSGLAIKLFGHKNVEGETLHLGALTRIEQREDSYLKHYEYEEIIIKEVIENDSLVIFTHPFWAYLFFKDVLKIDVFSLELKGIVYTKYDNAAEHANKSKYKVSMPFLVFSSLINDTIKDLELYTIIASFGGFLLSGIIIFMVTYLIISEISQQFSALFLLGYSKKTIHKVVSKYITKLLGTIVIVALLQLFALSFMLEFILAEFLKTRFSYNFSYQPYVFVIAFAVVLMILLLSFFKSKVNKVDLLNFSKRDL